MEQDKPPSVNLAEQLVQTDPNYINVMIDYWERRREEMLTGLKVADKELERFRGMKE